MNEKIVELAKEWLSYNFKGNVENIEILPFKTSHGLVVYFYDSDTWEDLPFFLTIPMVNELLEGKNIKKVKNQYNKKQSNDV